MVTGGCQPKPKVRQNDEPPSLVVSKTSTTDKKPISTKANPIKNGRGGWRGGGRPKGSLELKARTAIEVKNRIAQKADDLLNTALLDAVGSFIVMKADPETFEYQRVTDEGEIVRFIQEHKGANGRVGNSVYILAAKDGNYKSWQYLFDRAFGRPSQAVEVITDPEISKLKASIELRAKEKGVEYSEELRNYVEHYAPAPIKEKLTSELVQ